MGKRLKQGQIVALLGELGAGKTQFVRGVVQAFGLSADVVSSPTFTIAHEYAGDTPIYHLDLYRLKNAAEVQQSGVEEYFHGEGICLIEWPERAEHLLPESTLILRFSHHPDGGRYIEYLSTTEA